MAAGESEVQVFAGTVMAPSEPTPPPLSAPVAATTQKNVLSAVILRQQRRIAELEQRFRACQVEIQRLKRNAAGERQRSTSPAPAALLPTEPEDNKILACDGAQSGRPPTPSGETTPPAETSPARSPGSAGLEPPSRKRSMPGSQPRYWTEREHELFLLARKEFGARDYAAIADFVRSRTIKQVRTHAQKYELRCQRDGVQADTVPLRARASAGTGSDNTAERRGSGAPRRRRALGGGVSDDADESSVSPSALYAGLHSASGAADSTMEAVTVPFDSLSSSDESVARMPAGAEYLPFDELSLPQKLLEHDNADGADGSWLGEEPLFDDSLAPPLVDD